MKYFITLFLLLAMCAPVWGDDETRILPVYALDWEAHYNGFIDFIKVEAEDGRTHLFKPVMIENEDCVFGSGWHMDYSGRMPTQMQNYDCTPNGTYRLEWQHMGVE